MGKLGGSTRGAEHDSISVLSISALLLPDGVRAGDEVRLMLRREARRGRTTKQLLLVATELAASVDCVGPAVEAETRAGVGHV